MKLYLIPQDKANHFIYGCGAALVSQFASPFREAGALFFVAIAGATMLGIGTELWQRYDNRKHGLILHTVSWEDALATAVGGFAVGIPPLLV